MKLDYSDILRLLPVGHPFVLVDRVSHLEPNVRIVAHKAVAGSEPCYEALAPGLAPERYAYPRSLLIESFGQAAALLWLGTELWNGHRGGGEEELPMLGRLRDCRFHGCVFPGESVEHTVRLERSVGGNAFMSGESRVGDRTLLVVGSLLAVQRQLSSVVANR